MTVPPPEPPGDRGAEPPAPERHLFAPTDEEVNRSFAAIVSSWRPTPDTTGDPADRSDAAQDGAPEPGVTDGAGEDEGHYEPPEPPPVPTLHRATLGALALIVLGGVLLLVPGLIGLSGAVGFPIGLMAVTGGLAWLLARLRTAAPTDSGWDDGAQL